MFLTLADLQTLTGYVRQSKQAAWLRQAGIPFFLSGSGRPIVLKEALHERTVRIHGPQAHARLRLASANVPARR